MNSEVDNNRVGNGGCRLLSRAQWVNLRGLALGLSSLLQIKMRLLRRDAISSVKLTGLFSKRSPYVLSYVKKVRIELRNRVIPLSVLVNGASNGTKKNNKLTKISDEILNQDSIIVYLISNYLKRNAEPRLTQIPLPISESLFQIVEGILQMSNSEMS